MPIKNTGPKAQAYIEARDAQLKAHDHYWAVIEAADTPEGMDLAAAMKATNALTLANLARADAYFAYMQEQKEQREIALSN